MSQFDFEFAPFRPLDDFLLDGARFQIPPYRDPVKWNNRILANLIYYQTNYFAILFALFFLIGLVHPKDVLMGFLSICLVIAGVYFATSTNNDMLNFKQEHPVFSIIGMLTVAYFIVYMLSSVVVFVYGICLPVLLVLVHASIRLRNLKNKVTQKLEAVGFNKTAMGRLLDMAGIKVDEIQMNVF